MYANTSAALQDTVQRAAAFNRSLTRRAEAARVASPAAAVQEPLPASSPTSGAELATPAKQAPQLGADVEKAGLEAAAGSTASQTKAEPTLRKEPTDAQGSLIDNAAPAQGAETPAQPERVGSPSDSADVCGKDEASEPSGTNSEGAGVSETQEESSEPMPSPIGEGPGSSTALQEPQEQTETQDPKAEIDQQAPDSSSAGAPEVASTPRAEPKPMQDTPQAEQLLPALMRQVTLCPAISCSDTPPAGNKGEYDAVHAQTPLHSTLSAQEFDTLEVMLSSAWCHARLGLL